MKCRFERAIQKSKYIFEESPFFLGGVFIIGILIRLYGLGIRSLWRDEAWVALLASSDKFAPTFFTHWPIPPLFVSSLYLSVHLFKNNEWFLRMIPALFSIGGMFVIYYGVRNWLGKFEASASLILFSFMPVLIAYSRELKQYTCDIFFVLLLVLIAEYLLQRINRIYPWIILAVSGCIGLWFSYPIVFVLTAVGVITFWHTIRYSRNSTSMNIMEKYKPLFFWIPTFLFIIVSFVILYFIIIRNQLSTELESYWYRGFPDLSGIISFFRWLLLSIWSFFAYFWNSYAIIVTLFSLLGIWELYRTGKLRILSYWGIIFILILAASFLHRYPFWGGRTILFTAPFFIILFICGLKSACSLSKGKLLWKTIAYIGIMLLAVQAADAANYCKNDKGYFWYTQYPLKQNMKSALLMLIENRKANEPLYVYFGGDLAFEYYSKYYFKNKFNPAYIGKIHRDNYTAYINDMKPLIEERRPLWMLATHINVDELSYIHRVLVEDYGYAGDAYFQDEGAFLGYYSIHK